MRATGKSRLFHLLRAGLLLQLICLLLPRLSHADGISGFMEYNFAQTESNTRDSSGLTGKTTGNSLVQRYNLALDRTLYPNLHFSAGGNVELSKSEFETEAAGLNSSLTSKQTRFSPYANLRLNTGVTSAGAGYSRREERTHTSVSSPFTSINETYNAQFGLRPDALPSLDAFFTRVDLYDQDRKFQNTTNDSITLTSKYSLLKNLDLTYQVMASDLQDKLKGQDIMTLNQSARIGYSDTFFKERVSLYSTYNIATQDTEISANGVGEIMLQVPVIQTYFKDYKDLTPDYLINDDLASSSSALRDGDPKTYEVILDSGNKHPKAVVVELPPQATTNVIELVSVSTLNKDAMKEYLSRRFTWALYQTHDTLTTNGMSWNNIASLAPGMFEVEVDSSLTSQTVGLPEGSTVYRIKIRIPVITIVPGSTFLKIVMTPTQDVLATDPSSFTISEMQAWNASPAPNGKKKTSSVSGHYEMNSRVRILEQPSLFYDLNFTLDHFNSDTSSSRRYFVTNSLSLAHQFNSIYSGSARVSREDSFEPSNRRSAWIYSASVTAVPVPALTSSLLFSGRNEDLQGATSSSYSLFLNNNAELYRGVNVYLNGGISTATSVINRRSDNALFSFGANLVPHPKANINISVSGKKEWGTGGNISDSSTYKQDNEISFTVTPFRSLYLFGSLSFSTETDKQDQLLRTLGGSWAPFRDGNLLYNISYNESVASEGSQETRSLVNSLRWYLRPTSYLDLSYLVTRSSSSSQQLDSYSLNASVRFTF